MIEDFPRSLDLGFVVDLQRDVLVRHILEIGVGFAIGANGLALDGDKVVPFLDLQAWLRERRARRIGPVLAGIDLLDAEEPAVRFEVGPQKADADALAVGHISAADIGMRGVELGDHFADDIIEVAPVRDPGQERLVSLADRRPVGPAHAGVPVEVTLDSPGLAQELRPLFLWIGAHLHSRRCSACRRRLSCRERRR